MDTKLYRQIDPFPELLGVQHYHDFGNGLSWKSAKLYCQREKLTADITFHSSLRLVFTLNGKTHLHYGGHSMQLYANEGAMVSNFDDTLDGHKHFYAGAMQHEVVLFFTLPWLHKHGIHGDILDQLQHRLWQKQFTITTSMRIYLMQLLHSENSPSHWQSAVQQNLCMSLLLEILQQLFPYPSHSDVPCQHDKRLDTLFELLHSSKADNWTLAQIAHHCCSNPTTLQAAFKARYNTTIMHYLQQLKMQRAKQALMSGLSVNEAAMLVGYRKTECFSAQFYKTFGQYPSQFKT